MKYHHGMLKPDRQDEVIALPQAIDRYFDVAIYLLVLMGFSTLAGTGAVELPVVLAGGAALAGRGYLLAVRRRWVISERWTTPLTLLYFIFYAADYLLISRGFMAATVHLVLFAVVVRTFSLRRDRDSITLAILAFLMVLASAVLTVDSIFLIFLAGFMTAAVAAFILMEMKRSSRSAKFYPRPSDGAREHRIFAKSLAQITPVLALTILAVCAAVFFILPRTSAGYLGGYSLATDFSTGFSDRVQLGRIGQIQQSNAVVMHIQIDGDLHGEHSLRWRGVSLANFDGRNWSNPQEQYIVRPLAPGIFAIPSFSQGVGRGFGPTTENAREGLERLIHYRVVMEPIGTNIFFLAPWARRVGGAYRTLEIDSGGALSNLDGQAGVNIYEADSDISVPPPQQLREASESYSEIGAGRFSAAYLQLPAIDARIGQLAADVTALRPNNYEKAVALEKHLKTSYGYTLQLPKSEVADPIANFLFERKQGHCEYFASAMALMLRTLNIPARIVNGFRSDEFNDLSGKYVVRAKDAHSWVEAFFPGYGWVSFDPTPGGAVGTPQRWGRAGLYLDAAQSFWREWIVSYDSSHQNVLGQSVMNKTRGFWQRARSSLRLDYYHLLNWARRSRRGIEHSPIRWFAASTVIALLLIGSAKANAILGMIKRGALLSNSGRSPQQAAALWYERMARALARRGLRKATTQTAKEFLGLIQEERLRRRVALFTEAYESARFGDSASDASRLPELYDEVQAAVSKPRSFKAI